MAEELKSNVFVATMEFFMQNLYNWAMISLLLNPKAVETTAQYRCLITFWGLHLLVGFVLDGIIAFVVSMRMVQSHFCKKLSTGLFLVLLSFVNLDKIVILKTRVLFKARERDMRDYGVSTMVKQMI
jgi:hypothetical protein